MNKEELKKEDKIEKMEHQLEEANNMLNDKHYLLGRIKYLDSLPK